MALSSPLMQPATLLLCVLLSSAGTGPADDSARPPSPSAQSTAKPQSTSMAAAAAASKTSAAAKPARKTWTAADLAALSGHGVSVSGSQTERAALPAGAREDAAPDGTVLAQADVPVVDWAGRAAALRGSITASAARIETIDELSEQWGDFVLATGQNQAVAAFELGRLREERLVLADALSRAEAEFLALEEAARKAGVPPGQLR